MAVLRGRLGMVHERHVTYCIKPAALPITPAKDHGLAVRGPMEVWP